MHMHIPEYVLLLLLALGRPLRIPRQHRQIRPKQALSGMWIVWDLAVYAHVHDGMSVACTWSDEQSHCFAMMPASATVAPPWPVTVRRVSASPTSSSPHAVNRLMHAVEGTEKSWVSAATASVTNAP